VQVKPQEYDGRDQWKARPALGRALWLANIILPILAGFAVTYLLGKAFADPAWEWPKRLAWAIAMFVVGTAVATGLAHTVSRFVPLATLSRLNLAFPKAAPSRIKTALRVGNTANRERVVEEFRKNGLASDPQHAAIQVLHLVQELNTHDRKTRGHSERVRALSEIIGEEMGLNADDRNRLRWASLLHDVGKLSVPAAILNKQGKPTDEEWKLLQSHPAQGEWRIAPLRPWLGEWASAVDQHHERFDGSGYPHGLKGEEMPIGSRIVAVADAFEVMTAVRSYKKPMSYEDARAELVRCSGTHFDPMVVRVFLNVGNDERRVAGGFAEFVTRIVAGAASSLGGLGNAVGGAVGGSLGAGAAAAVLIGALAGQQPLSADRAGRTGIDSGVPAALALAASDKGSNSSTSTLAGRSLPAANDLGSAGFPRARPAGGSPSTPVVRTSATVNPSTTFAPTNGSTTTAPTRFTTSSTGVPGTARTTPPTTNSATSTTLSATGTSAPRAVTTLPASPTTVPGATTTAPGGASTTLPESSTTVVGPVSTVAGPATTVAGSTSTVAGTVTTTSTVKVTTSPPTTPATTIPTTTTTEPATSTVPTSTTPAVTTTTVPPGPYSVGNQIWYDGDNNGRFDPGEWPVIGATINLWRIDTTGANTGTGDTEQTGVMGAIERTIDRLLASLPTLAGTTTSNGVGQYVFTDLSPGDYRIEVITLVQKASSTGQNGVVSGPSEPAPDPDDNVDHDDNGTLDGTRVWSLPVTLRGPEPTGEDALTGLTDPTPDDRSNYTVDFGFFLRSSIGDRVWVDADADGVQDPGESGVANVTVRLLTPGGAVIATTSTAADGSYEFDMVAAATYVVEVVPPSGWHFTVQSAASDALDSDVSAVTGRATVVLTANTPLRTVDAGLVHN
jgi:protocatechuate 3,4-dioxygenase beta subunit